MVARLDTRKGGQNVSWLSEVGREVDCLGNSKCCLVPEEHGFDELALPVARVKHVVEAYGN